MNSLSDFVFGASLCMRIFAEDGTSSGIYPACKLIRSGLPSTHCEAPVACTVTSRVLIQIASLFSGLKRMGKPHWDTIGPGLKYIFLNLHQWGDCSKSTWAIRSASAYPSKKLENPIVHEGCLPIYRISKATNGEVGVLPEETEVYPYRLLLWVRQMRLISRI